LHENNKELLHKAKNKTGLMIKTDELIGLYNHQLREALEPEIRILKSHAKSSYHKNQSNTKISQLPSIDSRSFYFQLLVIKICTLSHATGSGGIRLFE